MWSVLFGWVFGSAMVLALVGLGVGVLSMSPPQYRLAEVVFSVAAVFLLGRIGWWIVFEYRHQSGWMQPAIFCFVVFGGAGVLWYTSVHWVEELLQKVVEQHSHAEQKHGSPVPPTAATVENSSWKGFQEKVDQITISLGAGGITRTGRLEEGVEVGFIAVGNTRIVSAKLVNGVPQFFLKLWSPYSFIPFEQKPPIEVNGNEVTIRDPNWDRNFSQSEYEVVDESGRPVFQLIRKTPDHFIVKGVFLIPNNPAVKYNYLYAGDAGWSMSDPRLGPPKGFKIRPIFKYPSRRHQGEYTDQ